MTDTQSEMVDGAMIVIGERVYFIPRDELRSYRVPEDVAGAVHEQMAAEVSGFSMSPDQAAVFGVQFDTGFKPQVGALGPREPLQFSSIMAHAATVLR
jgi:hypothetical protein